MRTHKRKEKKEKLKKIKKEKKARNIQRSRKGVTKSIIHLSQSK